MNMTSVRYAFHTDFSDFSFKHSERDGQWASMADELVSRVFNSMRNGQDEFGFMFVDQDGKGNSVTKKNGSAVEGALRNAIRDQLGLEQNVNVGPYFMLSAREGYGPAGRSGLIVSISPKSLGKETVLAG